MKKTFCDNCKKEKDIEINFGEWDICHDCLAEYEAEREKLDIKHAKEITKLKEKFGKPVAKKATK